MIHSTSRNDAAPTTVTVNAGRRFSCTQPRALFSTHRARSTRIASSAMKPATRYSEVSFMLPAMPNVRPASHGHLRT